MEKIETKITDSNCSSDTESQDCEDQILLDFIYDHQKQHGLLQNT